MDCGSKTLSNDIVRGPGRSRVYGVVFTALDSVTPDPSLVIERASEEHAVVRSSVPSRLEPGDLVRVVPNHSCVVSNLVDQVWVVDGNVVVEQLEVSARGRIA